MKNNHNDCIIFRGYKKSENNVADSVLAKKYLD